MKKYSNFSDNDWEYIYVFDDERSIYYLVRHHYKNIFWLYKDHKIGPYHYSVMINDDGTLNFEKSRGTWGSYWTQLEIKNSDTWNEVLKHSKKYLLLK